MVDPVEGLRHEFHDLTVDGVHLGVVLAAENPVAEIDQRGRLAGFDHLVGPLEGRQGHDVGAELTFLVGTGGKIVEKGLARFRSCRRPCGPAASILLDLGRAPAMPSFSILATDSATPMASQVSKGPISKLKPHFMALSISTMLSEISGIRLAA
ncbi:MAG: hypothetical protein U5J82_08040 [Desulfobacterales bacterium]|nr:hypothetical protein [Desulfobacterales bacterium]